MKMMFAMQDQSGSLEPPMNSMLLAAAAASSSCNRPLAVERGSRTRPHPSQVLKCPRCDSLNTKFCYYNNYNLSQPRHFCKNCRRYWTKGGVLRNVPVGGGCRKNNHTKKSKPRNSSSAQRRNPPPAAKSTSNSTATVSSSESSPLTVTNIQETASSSTSLNSSVNTDRSNGYKFGSELQEILNGNYGYSNGAPDKCSMIPMPRLFNGHANLDYFLQELPQKQAPDLLNSGNLLSNIEANCSFSSLLGGSNFVGVSFSDIQSKLQQQKLAALNINEVEAPAPAAAQNAEVLTGNNYSNIIPLDWQVNSNNSEILLDDAYCWGAETETIWPDPATAQFTYPSGF